MGTLAIVDMHKAEVNPGTSVVKFDDACCGPARVITSADGKDVWVTAGAVQHAPGILASWKLISDPKHALVARVPVGGDPARAGDGQQWQPYRRGQLQPGAT